MRLINWDQIPPRAPRPGIATRRFDSDGMTIVRYEFQPGASFPRHSHPEEQVVIVLRGRVTFTVDGHPLELGPGDICHVGAHVPHGATAGPEPVEFLNLLSPRRTAEDLVYYGGATES